jgi:excisionase family DNA binding protein
MSELAHIFAPEVVAAIERLIDARVKASLAEVRAGEDRRWLTPREAGDRLGCSERAIYQRIRVGRIPPDAVKHSGRRVYIDRPLLDRALERGL